MLLRHWAYAQGTRTTVVERFGPLSPTDTFIRAIEVTLCTRCEGQINTYLQEIESMLDTNKTLEQDFLSKVLFLGCFPPAWPFLISFLFSGRKEKWMGDTGLNPEITPITPAKAWQACGSHTLRIFSLVEKPSGT